MIEARELTKRYGDKTVVDNLSCMVYTPPCGPEPADSSPTTPSRRN
ncbi:hypothetical protein N4G69_46215 [Streptomyces mirabilis]|nr:hypothetical protein [Streptomyces mirabilis]MCT9112857.1 hypothetical protein [Streptomyces mirabilis]